MTFKTISVNSKGMITIPVEIRKKYNIKEGSEIVIADINGELEIIPIVEDFADLQQRLKTREEKYILYQELEKEELRLENRE